MQFQLSIIDPAASTLDGVSGAGPSPVDVLVDAPVDTPLGAVLQQVLTEAGIAAPTSTDPLRPVRLLAEGRPVPAEAALGAPPLVNGALLTLDRGDAVPVAPHGGSLVELHVIGGPGAGQLIHVGRGIHVIGRGPHCAARLEDPGVSRAHAELVVSDTGVTLRDLSPTNGTTIDGRPVPADGAPMHIGAHVRIASTTVVRRRSAGTPAPATHGPGTFRVHRRPRFVAAIPPVTIEFPATPQKPEGHRLPVIAAVAPVVLAVVLAWVMTSPAMLLFALMSPVMLIGQWLSDRRHGRVSHRRQLADHVRATAAAGELLASSLAAETIRRHDEQPDLAVVQGIAGRREARIWERRPHDPDHLVLRLGSATQPAWLTANGTDPAHPGVRDVPAILDLKEVGVAGVCGPRARAFAVLGGLIAQLATWHSPRDVRLVILTTADEPTVDWAWAARLPHARPGDGGSCVATVASVDDETALGARVGELEAVVRSRAEQVSRLGSMAGRPEGPDLVVVLDGAHDLRLVPGLADLLRLGPAVGVRFLCLDESAERLPVETTLHIVIDATPTPAAVISAASGQLGPVIPDLPTVAWLERLGRALAPLEDATPDVHQSSLPHRVSFADLHRCAPGAVDPTDAGSVARAWLASPGVPRALLGVSTTGPYAAQLDRDGPHTLVGGTTGSGKSELLQTLVAGLAVSCRPDQLAFVLVDYKGGSAFKDCARLPHTLGVVTDLDEHLTARALTSLGAELKRRERLLAEAGAKDLADYQRRARPGSPALPRLVLVVDEFKMLADELPDFVDGLVRIAAVGRSLGVHLVLATQRPGGIVSGDMRANVALRIALRVRDRVDSEDVIEAPDAASVSERFPGRGWIRSAGGQLLEIQTAHVGGPADGEQVLPESPAAWRLRWSDLAAPAPRRPAQERPESPRTELAAVVDATRTAASSLGITPLPSPWLAALPELLSITQLLPAEPIPAEPMRAEPISVEHPRTDDPRADDPRVCIGLADLPQEQRQSVWAWDLDAGHLALAGGSRTGRSTALRTIATTLAHRLGPDEVHLHVLEGASGSLADLEQLPQVGSVTGTADPARTRRAIARLVDQLTAPPSPPPFGTAGRPRTVVLIDGWESLKECLEEIEHGQPVDDLMRILRDGLASRIHVAVTGGRAVIAGQLPSLVQQRLVLALPDPLDLVLAGIPADAVPTHQPPGRAVDVRTGAEVQLAVWGELADRSAQTEATRVAALAASARWGDGGPGRPWRVAQLPDLVHLAHIPDPGLPLLPVGVGGDDLTPLGFDLGLDQRRILVAGAARTGRSTTLLAIAERLLAGGRELAVVTTRRSPLTQLSGIRQAHVLTPHDSEAFVALRRDRPDVAILVDDAEGIEGTPIERALVEATRLVDPADGFVAISVDLRRASEHYRGLVPHVSAQGTGVLLSPKSAADGEIFRIRVEDQHGRRPGRRPGRGLLIVDAVVTPIQVGLPTAGPAVIGSSPSIHSTTIGSRPRSP